MKKLSYIIFVFLFLGFNSCKNSEWEFPDYDYNTVSFPYQYPVRTLILGDYVYDNENDNNLKFQISARIGGLYENQNDWRVNFRLNESLVNSLLTNQGDTIKLLPSAYYTLTPNDHLIIPKGKSYGSIDVQLTEAFLDNMYAHKVRYVIPVEIISSDADSILSGSPAFAEADPRIAGEWSIKPKNFTLFGIKYVNPYHGQYLYRGQSVVSNGTDIDTTFKYRARYPEQNPIIAINTTGKNVVKASTKLKTAGGATFMMYLTFDSNNNCVITESEDSPFPVTGNGKYVKDADEWGGKKRDAIHLNYQVTEGTIIHTMNDTLVFRDKGVSFQEFVPVVVVN